MKNSSAEKFISENDTVRIICSEDSIQGLNEHWLSIRYPEHWFAPVTLSPFAQKIEQETISWMQELGLIKDKQSLSHVLAMEPRYYAGYSHSMASYEYALLYCKCVTMWLLWDDERVEVARNFDEIEAPIKALCGEHIPVHQRDDPYVRAFKHLGDEYERLGASRRWRERFATRMIEWGSHAIHEEVLRRHNDSTENRSLEEAIQLRTVTIGFKPATIPVEQTAGIELPDELLECETYESILDCAAKICFIINDIVGVPKDICNDQKKSNLVLHYMSCNNVSLSEAYSKIIEIHDHAVERYDTLVEHTLNSFPPAQRDKLNNYFNLIRYLETGFGIWQSGCVRYQNKFAVQRNQVFRIDIIK